MHDWTDGQTLLQPPQSALLAVVSMHVVPHSISPDTTQVHAPPAHVVPPGQTLPQWPQLAASL
jgi:hypothetical protein